MQRIFNKKVSVLILSLVSFFWVSMARAICPVCVVAVGAGLGFSKWLGVDNAISSVWIGAVLMALVLWTIIIFKKKNWDFIYYSLVITAGYYLLTFVPLYYAGIVGHPANIIFGTDKIIFGVAIGSIAMLASNWLNIFLKKKNNGKVFVPYQKVILPLIILLIISLILWKII